MTPTQTEIESALTCQCGCGLTVHSCNHVDCSSAKPLQAEIATQIGSGKTGAEILDHFAGRYGEKILSAPTATGFNLLAWITPFAAVLIAGFLIVRWTRRWQRTAPPAPPPPTPGGGDAAARRATLESELERFDA